MAYSDKEQNKLENTVRRLEDSDFGEHNRELLLEFKNYLLAQNLSASRIDRYLTSMKTLQPHIDFDLDKAERSDIMELVGKINQGMLNEKDYSVWTKAEFKKALVRFYKWQRADEEPEIIDFITTSPKKSEKPVTHPDELPTPEDVQAIKKAMQNPRDEAFIQVLWESGGRIGEILSLKWQDFNVKSRLATLKLRGKTGERKVPVKDCIQDLEAWQEIHPEPEPDCHIFTNLVTPAELSYAAVKSSMRRALKYVDVDCKTNFHAFRKARATWLSKNGMNVFQLMQFFGWDDPDTAMTYVRMAHSDLEEAFLDICDGDGENVDKSTFNTAAMKGLGSGGPRS